MRCLIPMGPGSVFFELTINVLFSVMTCVCSTETYVYNGGWQFYSGDTPFVTLMNVPVQTCIEECRLRHGCLVVNFWRIRRVCEMFLTDTVPIVNYDGGTTCIFIKMSDVQLAVQPTTDRSLCSTCEDHTVCDVAANRCAVKECRALQIDYGEVQGNMLQVGSTVKVICEDRSRLESPAPYLTCLAGGHWSGQPMCIPTVEQWVHSVTYFSSQYTDTSWSAEQITGPFDTYPRYGDIVTSWASRERGAIEFIEVKFQLAVYITQIDVYETYHAGGVKRISARDSVGEMHVLYETATVEDIHTSRIFSPPIQTTTFKSSQVRLDVDCTVSGDWVEIDAILLHGELM